MNFSKKTDGDLRTVRDALISMTSAFVLNKDDDTGKSLMVGLLSAHIESPEAHVRYLFIFFLQKFNVCKNVKLNLLLLGMLQYIIQQQYFHQIMHHLDICYY